MTPEDLFPLILRTKLPFILLGSRSSPIDKQIHVVSAGECPIPHLAGWETEDEGLGQEGTTRTTADGFSS